MSNQENSTVLVDANAPQDPVTIAGYTLEERLGVGGYGEVWRGVGPGGLSKAIKILFGLVNGPQADSELKSLERIRNLRHPFLLNIERIEVVDERLIVVTELADGCLDDCFNEHRAAGHPGIPRDELLAYLRDAADALDFMLEQHGLQHLDIKPENLLVQGKHIKVGDFGLIKDISNTQVSMVGGFTPLYAPPEIFEGRPSPTSDQYSLAIVYQTMLTGTPPFSGRNAAQLTAQHLRSSPDLSSLQPVDRPVIARALSKNPSARFSSCRSFVDELTKRRTSRARSKTRVEAKPKAGGSRTQRLDAASLAAGNDAVVVETTPIAPKSKPELVTHRPTLVIGVGGLGISVVSDLRAQVEAAFGVSQVPALAMLCIDSDRANIRGLTAQSNNSPGFTDEEVVPVPLRASSAYRSDESLDLSWLSRRWLFNIPRSGEVEGIRPLGRLAIIDHANDVTARIKSAMSGITAEKAVVEAPQVTSLPVYDADPEVIIVGSISGGFSGGAIQDVGLMAAEACRQLEIEPHRIVGVLLHGTSGQRQIGDIQEANTVSCLKELSHAFTPGLSDARPFDNTYLVHLGDGLNVLDYTRWSHQVATWVFTNSLTNSRGVFEQWRESDAADPAMPGTVRTLGMASIDAAVFSAITTEAQSLCAGLLNSWRAVTSSTGECPETDAMLAEMSLSADTLSGKVMSVLRGRVGRQIETWSSERWAALSSNTPAERDRLLQQLEDAFEDASDPSVGGVMETVCSSMTRTPEQAADRIREHVVCLLDEPARLAGATGGLVQIVAVLEAARQGADQLLAEIERNIEQLKSADGENSQGALQTECNQFCILLFYRGIYRFFSEYVGSVEKQTRALSSQLTEMRIAMADFAARFAPAGSAAQPEQLIREFDTQLQSSNRFHLSDLMDDAVDIAETAALLTAEAERFLFANSGVTETSPQQGFPEAAGSHFVNTGGGRHVLARLPQGTDERQWQKKLTAAFGECITLDQTALAELTVFCEVEGIPFNTLLHNFTIRNPRLPEVAARVHTRIDISW